MWRCISCGTENMDDFGFCTGCGQPRPVGSPAVNYAAAPKKKSKLPWIILAAVLVLALVGGCLYFFLWRTPHYRMTAARTVNADGIVTDVSYTYLPDGVNFVAESRVDGELRTKASGTVDKSGAFTSIAWTDLEGLSGNRMEYVNDKYGNHIGIRIYDREGNLQQESEIEYNRYRVMEKRTTTYYSDGQVARREYIEFSDENNGLVWSVSDDGSRELSGRILRLYGDDHRSYRQTNYNADGELIAEYTYVLDKHYNILNYTFKTDYSNYSYTYQWEKVK